MRNGSRRRFGSGVLFLALGAMAIPRAGSGQEEHRIRGNEVAVYNLAGAVEIVSGSGSDVVVQVMRGGSDANQLEAGIQEIGGRQALVIRYPGDQVVYPELGRGSRSQIRVRSDGTFYGERGSSNTREVTISGSGNGLEAWADLRISVPRGKDFALYLATGETDLQGVDGTILIDAGSGEVRARASSGELSIDTGSGGVTVQGMDGDLEVDTGSGGVELSDVRGDEVRVDTGSGSVTASSCGGCRPRT
jgi:lia operon protein LiaG